MNEQDLVYRLRKRAEIRRQITTRKSVQENKPDRIADLLEEAATEIVFLKHVVEASKRNENRLIDKNEFLIELLAQGGVDCGD